MVTSSLSTGRASQKARLFLAGPLSQVCKIPLTHPSFRLSVFANEVGQSDREQKKLTRKGPGHPGPFFDLSGFDPRQCRTLPKVNFTT